ncbi:S8/S53 family peptidase [Streptomyces sp. NPDC051976]|uniref:S8/S53 family peptidase n=1 Tax=Streptomyces sp. NPDC051976 TaxID=3154947 RepID=UPI00341C2DD2
MPQDVYPLAHYPDQLVVDLRHLQYVKEMLADLGFSHSGDDEDEDELLGLALLRELAAPEDNEIDVSDVLALLRQRSASERDGWVPVLGVNRQVDSVIGEGHKPMFAANRPVNSVITGGHKPMSGAEPQPAGAAEVPRTLVSGETGRGVHVGVVDTRPAPEPVGAGHTLPFRSGHGVFVTSLIQRQAPAAEVAVEGILDPSTGRADAWEVARAVARLAAAQPLDILNLSLGCYTLSGGPPLAIARAVERLGSGVLVVAAAGNHGAVTALTAGRTARSACWPAAMPPVIAVGSVDEAGAVPPWSPGLPWVHCLAPGVDVVGSYLTGEVELSDGGHVLFDGYARWSGTSFSAATVSGAVAARTVPGTVTPQQALRALIEEGTLVRPFPDGP